MKLNRISLVLAMVGVTSWAIAQEYEGQINPNSLIPIARYEQLFKVRVWRNIDLREKQNKGYFARGNEITKLILDAVKSGELADIYYKDSVNRKMPKDEFMGALVAQQGQNFPPWDPSQDWYAGDRVTVGGKNYEAIVDSRGVNPVGSNDWQQTSAGKAVEFLPFEIYKLTMQEDIIFDKRRSRLYYDIQAIQMSAFDITPVLLKTWAGLNTRI
jgi:hypothetical protein